METLQEKFWNKVDKRGEDECWEWRGAKTVLGYGKFSSDFRAHRYSWELQNGSIPPGMLVCHHCDNPSCVNPKHLFLGTHKDNTQDMVSKKRCASGERNGNSISNGRVAHNIGQNNGLAKLTWEQVDKIRIERKTRKLEDIAADYGVSDGTISSIVRYITWKDKRGMIKPTVPIAR